jgi:hypothetical protein
MNKAILERFKWRKKELFISAVVLFLYLSLNKVLFELYNKFVVGKVLAVFSPEPFGLVLFLLYLAILGVFAYVLYQKIVVEELQISLFIVFLLFSTNMIYWYERVTDQHYDFFPLIAFFGQSIAQSDLIFILALAAALLLTRNYFKNYKYPENKSFFLQDLPIKQIGDDKFNRGPFYNDIIDKLKLIAFDTDRGFAIGLNSVWGYGKTSLLEMIRAEFAEKKNKKTIVCINYNPWLSANKRSLTYDFFTVIEKELSKYISKADILLEYGKKVSKYDNDHNPLKGLGEVFESETTLEERFKEISEMIRQTGKRFFIIIDDLDRLDNDEVFEVLRLIRNVANFPRLNYIVAYDRQYLINALKEKKIYNPAKYLEKIFELEIELPKIEEIKIREMLNKTIRDGLAQIMLTQADRLAFENQVAQMIFNPGNLTALKVVNIFNIVPTAFKSKRDIVKFTNSLLFSISLNKNNVYLPDLFALEIIKLINSPAYDVLAISDKYLEIFEPIAGGDKYYKLFQPRSSNPPSTLNALRDHLFNIERIIKVPWQRSVIQALFSKPESNDLNFDKTIALVDNLKSYFIFAVATPQIVADFLNQLLN